MTRSLIAALAAFCLVGCTSPAPEPEPTFIAADEAYLAALRRIGPDLERGNPVRAIRWGWELCNDLAALPAAQWSQRAAQRFSGGGVEVSVAEGAAIVQVVRVHLCP